MADTFRYRHGETNPVVVAIATAMSVNIGDAIASTESKLVKILVKILDRYLPDWNRERLFRNGAIYDSKGSGIDGGEDGMASWSGL